MKSLILISMLMTFACAEEPHRDEVTTIARCTSDDPDCGAPGSDPYGEQRAETVGWTNATYNVHMVESGVSCSTDDPGLITCTISLVVGGHWIVVGCVFWPDGSWSCDGD